MSRKNKSWLILIVLLALLISLSSVNAKPINATHADGLVAYSELNIQTPRYRTWNESLNFSAESSANNVGGDITWVVTRANHERDEIIVGIEDKNNDVNILIYNSSKEFGNLLEVSADVFNSNSRGFDIAVEDISGNVLIVYENSSNADTLIEYRIWNGTNYSAQHSITTGLSSSPIRWVSLTPRKGSNDIMLLIHDNTNELHAIPWNGTNFDITKNITLSTATTSNALQHFAFAWEQSSSQGLAVYGDGTNLVYRTYSPTAPYWSVEATIDLGNALNDVRLCSDTASDYIGIIMQDGGNDVNVRMWDGTQILGSPPAQEGISEPNGANNANIDCAWLNSTTALFGFIDSNLLSMDYFTFSKTNTWSTADLTLSDTTVSFASDDISAFRFTKHPVTSEIMVVAMDMVEDISAIRWNGTDFANVSASPIETSGEVTDGDQEGVMFDWYRYDTAPNVTLLKPNGDNFNINNAIIINATVRDNVNVSVVLANITLPNATIQQLILIDSDNDKIFNNTFNGTITGTFTIRIIANDTSLHNNINSSESVNFTVGDAIKPNVTIMLPVSGTSFNLSNNVTIRVNATDNINISVVLANITLPNSTIQQLNLSKWENNITYEVNFTGTALIGTYTIRIIANDTSNNINSTETTIFTIGDAVLPSVINLTPAAGTNFELNANINITANVTDNINVSVVLANITLPNSTIIQITLLDPENDTIYNSSFSSTSLTGTYNVTIIANDTSNNINSSETTYFTVGNLVKPTIALNSLINYYNTSNTTLTFNFTATDDVSLTLNCSITIDGAVNKTNNSVSSGAYSLFIVSGFADGAHSWNVTCNDTSGNSNTSETRYFAVDTSYPTFISLTTSPSSALDIDPGVNVTAIANVTDTTTKVDTVMLLYKLNTASLYTNITMNLNSGDGLYNITFNASQNGTYNLRLWANDSLGNSNTSAIVNITVEFERTWTRTPSTFNPVYTTLDNNITLGNLTINNTADYTLNFTITSDSNYTLFNESANFSLTAGNAKTLTVNDTASIIGIKTITLNISASPDANPASQTTTGTIIVAPGQPVLSATFTTPSAETVSASQGQIGVEFTAKLENIGQGNASNISFFITLPSDWTITFGATNLSYNELEAGDSIENTILVTIPSNAATGTKYVYANATGFNATGADLGSLGFVFGDKVTVTIASSQQLGGGGGGGDEGGESGTGSQAAGGGGEEDEGEGGALGGIVTKTTAGGKETIYTSETMEVVRGTKETIPVSVTNIYRNAVLENIMLEVQGFLSQYIKIEPILSPAEKMYVETRELTLNENQGKQLVLLTEMDKHYVKLNKILPDTVEITFTSTPVNLTLTKGEAIELDTNDDGIVDTAIVLKRIDGENAVIDVNRIGVSEQEKLYFGETRNYSLTIFAPTYLKRELKNLTVKISAKMSAINPEIAGFDYKNITEFRTLSFIVHEIGREVAEFSINESMNNINEMSNAGFLVERINSLLKEAEKAVEEHNYEQASKLGEQISTLKKSAFEADKQIKEVNENLKNAKSRWLNAYETEKALLLARTAFEREDFETALQRAKDAQLMLMLETKGKLNIIWFLTKYWWLVILGAVVLSIVSFIIYKRTVIWVINQRLRSLAHEELTIYALMRDAQAKCFEQNVISSSEYKNAMLQYEARLNKIKQLRIKLRNKRVGILTTEQELDNLEREEKEIKELIKEEQKKYFEKGALGRTKFMDIFKSDKIRLAEVEDEKELLKEKLGKEKNNNKHKFLELVNDLNLKSIKLFHKIKSIKGRKNEKNPDK